jgi:hypothetical protein
MEPFGSIGVLRATTRCGLPYGQLQPDDSVYPALDQSTPLRFDRFPALRFRQLVLCLVKDVTNSFRPSPGEGTARRPAEMNGSVPSLPTLTNEVDGARARAIALLLIGRFTNVSSLARWYDAQHRHNALAKYEKATQNLDRRLACWPP